jgi:hypothetical protein
LAQIRQSSVVGFVTRRIIDLVAQLVQALCAATGGCAATRYVNLAVF